MIFVGMMFVILDDSGSLACDLVLGVEISDIGIGIGVIAERDSG